MGETKRNNPVSIVAGVLYALIALYFIYFIIQDIIFYRYILGAFYLIPAAVGYLVAAVSLFVKQRKLTAVGYIIIAGYNIVGLVRFAIQIITYGTAGSPGGVMLSFFSYLLIIVSYALAVCIAFNIFKKAWFVPAICFGLYFSMNSLYRFVQYNYIGDMIETSVYHTMELAAILLACLWLAYPNGMPQKAVTPVYYNGNIPPRPMQQSPVNSVPPTNGAGYGGATPGQYAQPTNGTGYGNRPPVQNTQPVNVVEEMKKYKELLDAGIITQEEFEKKKKQLLDL